MSTLPPISSYPMVTPAVTKPRQLAPTVGRVSKSVIITGEAQRETKNLIISKVTVSQYKDDRAGYSVEKNALEEPVTGSRFSGELEKPAMEKAGTRRERRRQAHAVAQRKENQEQKKAS